MCRLAAGAGVEVHLVMQYYRDPDDVRREEVRFQQVTARSRPRSRGSGHAAPVTAPVMVTAPVTDPVTRSRLRSRGYGHAAPAGRVQFDGFWLDDLLI